MLAEVNCVLVGLQGEAFGHQKIALLATVANRSGGTSLAGFAGYSPSPGVRKSHSNPGRLQVSTGCFSTHTRGLLDAP
jgi:hypothetical protein